MSILFSKIFLKRFFRRISSKLKMKKKRCKRAASFTFLILEQNLDKTVSPMSSPFPSWCNGSRIENLEPYHSWTPNTYIDNSKHYEFLNCIGLLILFEFQMPSLLYPPLFRCTYYNASFDCCQEENFLDEFRLIFFVREKGNIFPLSRQNFQNIFHCVGMKATHSPLHQISGFVIK